MVIRTYKQCRLWIDLCRNYVDSEYSTERVWNQNCHQNAYVILYVYTVFTFVSHPNFEGKKFVILHTNMIQFTNFTCFYVFSTHSAVCDLRGIFTAGFSYTLSKISCMNCDKIVRVMGARRSGEISHFCVYSLYSLWKFIRLLKVYKCMYSTSAVRIIASVYVYIYISV